MTRPSWLVVGFGGNRGLQLLATLILARILLPADFGNFALAASIASALMVLGDLGLSAALTSRRTLTRVEEETAAGSMTAVAGLLGLVGAFGGALLAYWGVRPLGGLICGISAVLGVSGYSWYLLASAKRRFQFREIAVAQILQGSANLALAVSGALIWESPYAFVAGQAGGVVGLTGYLAYKTKGPRHLRFAWSGFVSSAREGKAFLAQGGIGFFSQNVDNYAVGLLAGPRDLGFYSMAYRLGELPYQAFSNPLGQALFAKVAQADSDRERRRLLAGTLAPVLVVAAPGMAILALEADNIVRTVFGDAWLPMVPLLKIMALWGLVRAFQGVLGWFLNGVGDAAWMARFAAVLLPFTVLSIVVGTVTLGPLGAAIAMTVDIIASASGLTKRVHKRALLPAVRGSRSTLPACCAWVAFGGAAYAVNVWLPAEGQVALAVSIAAPLGSYALAIAVPHGLRRRARKNVSVGAGGR